jgi:hypothetical protein
VYSFDIESDNLTLVQNFTGQQLNSYNGIITKNAYYSDMNIDENISEYFSIINGQLVKIGEKYDYGGIRETYFFPEKRKMVQHSDGGYWVYDIEFTTVTDKDETLSLAKSNHLNNYPNPFNPKTTISFSLTTDSHVKLDIYNIKGQKVRNLINDFRTIGIHKIVWDGRDDQGQEMGSGVYLYRLQAGELTKTKKMLLIK